MTAGSTLNSFVAESLTLCFLRGTMIACPDGERAVEALSIGDLVLTAGGAARAVQWIGHGTILSPAAGVVLRHR